MTERFELLEQLGRGGMGTVWKAHDRETGEVLALKLLHSQLADDEEYTQRLEREVEIVRRLHSGHIVHVSGYGRRDGVPYMSMEYVEGESLRDVLRYRKKLDWDETHPIVSQVADALQTAHLAGVIHRDIKPANILVNREGSVKVVDFGISRALDLTRLTGGATMLGTPAYMAPEADVTPLSDLYALGCVTFELLSGSAPFEGESQQQVWFKHLTQEPDLSKVPEEARALVAWMLQKNPEHRIQSAEQLRQVLDGTMSVPSMSGNRRSRRTHLPMVAASAVLAAVAVGLVVYWPRNPAPAAPAEAAAAVASSPSVPSESAVASAVSTTPTSSTTSTTPEVAQTSPAAVTSPAQAPSTPVAETSHFRGVVTSIFTASDDPGRIITNVQITEAVGDSRVKDNGRAFSVGWRATDCAGTRSAMAVGDFVEGLSPIGGGAFSDLCLSSSYYLTKLTSPATATPVPATPTPIPPSPTPDLRWVITWQCVDYGAPHGWTVAVHYSGPEQALIRQDPVRGFSSGTANPGTAVIGYVPPSTQTFWWLAERGAAGPTTVSLMTADQVTRKSIVVPAGACVGGA